MYDCPNCGGNLRFDIPLQQLHCDYCGTNMDPYSYEKQKDAVESQVFETTVFTCPQCGGEIMTTNVSATGFCMYCGASTILDSRIRNEKRPARIIPFQKTKEDCKKSFSAMMRRSLYAPKELKSPEYLEKFRGIYIPYWIYDYRIEGIRGLRGSTSSRKGDYIITNHYSLSCDLDAAYNGVSFDASSSLDDSLSESIAPFDTKDAKDFTPSFLCGFYADTADVPSSVYNVDALFLIAEDVLDRAKSEIFPGKGMETPGSPENVLTYRTPEPYCAMFPVWFLTYRHRERVAYAVMNGQTGRISSDLPIVEWKYIFGSLLMAVPLFMLFNAFLTVTAPTALLITMIPAAAAGIAFLSEIRAQLSMEAHEGDKGWHASIRTAPGVHPAQNSFNSENDPSAQTPASGETVSSAQIPVSGETVPSAQIPGSPEENTFKKGENKGSPKTSGRKKASKPKDAPKDAAGRKTSFKKMKKSLWKGEKSPLPITIIVILYCVYAGLANADSVGEVLRFLLHIIPVLIGIWLAVSGARLQKEHGAGKVRVFPGIAGSILALVLSESVSILRPVSDLYYYGAGIVSILCTGITLTAVVRRYNHMATRPLPSFFDRKGGDVRG